MRPRFAACACTSTDDGVTIDYAYDGFDSLAGESKSDAVHMRAPGVVNRLGFVDMTGATPVPYLLYLFASCLEAK